MAEFCNTFFYETAHQSPADTLQNTSLTLSQVWERAANFSKAVQMKQLHLESSVEQIKDAKSERLPEVNIDGEYARITNMPIYDNGLLKVPQQFEVLHQTYTAGADAYLNLYNGNKTNIEINARKPFTFYLLILIGDDEKTPEHEVGNKIEDNCQYLAHVIA